MTACCYWGPATSALSLFCAFSLLTPSVAAQQPPSEPDGQDIGEATEASQPAGPEESAAKPAPAVEAPEGRTTDRAEAPAKPTRAPAPSTLVTGATNALVHLYVDFPGAWLELRGAVDPEAWQPACQAPCDQILVVEGKVARIRAPGMTPSNVFRIDPGAGTANIKVAGGSATLRLWGIIALAAGLPVTLLGAGLYGYASVTDSDTLATAGIATLAVGAVSIAASVPLLLTGSTTVRDGRGKFVADAANGAYRF